MKASFCQMCGEKMSVISEYFLKCNSCGFEHFINPVAGTVAIIVNQKNEILLNRGVVPPKDSKWSLIGGFVNVNESFEECLIREINEEIGILLNPDEFKYLKSYPDFYDYKSEKKPILNPVFWIQISPELEKKIKPNPREISEIKFFARENIPFEEFAFPNLDGKAIKDFLDGEKY